MKPHDLIANKILEFLRPDSFDEEEEKLLREKDQVWKGEVTLIDCLHNAILTHTNGDTECLRCHKIWKKKDYGKTQEI